ncbi:LLM class flavin-dependent oxidoreductase [Achromobacter sp. AONIH1]|uniref:LLM class flavin-dependent oxidoreductase n=1 Tax=Achromobacter sp. AONIH1 TaxID=1758194 RepID=UPI000CD2D402|nr:LLM class flavin-dependent oxidoreductase [Achromobacter sp. AONIH1]AUT48461.1 N5,N10-methylene tetrahydromethanopterin reductase [Achromobacter sp. AONIH1]
MGKQIRLNAFDMNTVGHIAHGYWAHPRDQSRNYRDLDYWVELAGILERGKFDGLFLADTLGMVDGLESDPGITLREAVQAPMNDPLLLVSAMAHATRHLGFGVTANLSHAYPYVFARSMSTLDHLTRGRIGWNIVTGHQASAARALGQELAAHDDRYAIADDFMEAVYKLWEGSWDDDAVRVDRERRIFADPAGIRVQRHAGPYYRYEGAHLSEPSPQRTPVLYQAGASSRGQRFAAAHAECVFLTGAQPAVRDIVAALRKQVQDAGRRREDIQVYAMATVIVGETDAQAWEKHAEYARYANPMAALAHYGSQVHIDFSRYGLDEPIQAQATQGIQTLLDSITTRSAQTWTVRKLLAQMQNGYRLPPIVGSPQTVADALAGWMRETDIDGFNLTRLVAHESLRDFVDLVVPELQSRGIYKEDYAPGTLREKLFSAGAARLPASHPAASHRPGRAG